MATAWILGSVAFVSLLSLAGVLGLSFGLLRRHGTMMFLLALAAGTLIGDATLHLLPEAAHDGFEPRHGLWILAGFVGLFGLEVVLRWRHDHAVHIEDVHEHRVHDEPEIQSFGWVNLVGDAAHNLLDGIIIAAAYLLDTAVGFATTVAVALHEIPQELGDFAVLVRSGMAPAKALLWNLGSAAIAFVGAGIVLVSGLDAEALTTWAVPVIAGAFIYIAAADLVPELHHHTRGRDIAIILVGFVLGIAAMAGLLQIEGLFGEAGHNH